MKTRILSIILVCLLILTCSPLALNAAETVDYLKNGNIEEVKSDGKSIKYWSALEEAYDLVTAYSDDAADGEYSAHINSTGKTRVRMIQRVADLMPGGTYQFTVYTNMLNRDGYAQVSIEIGSNRSNLNIPTKTNRWAKSTMTFTVPKTSNSGYIYVGAFNGMDVLFDGMSFVGPKAGENDLPENPNASQTSGTSETKVILDVAENRKQPTGTPESVPAQGVIEGAENLFQNGGFEDDSNHIGPWHWESWKGWGNEDYIIYDTTFGHESSRSIKITNGDKSLMPWTRQIVDVDGGAEYQVGIWVYTNNTDDMKKNGGDTVIKLEFYNDEPSGASYLGENTLFDVPDCTEGKWVQYVETFTAPPGAKKATIYGRRLRQGTIWIDDMTLYSTKKPNPMSIETDQVFYYSDQTKPGRAQLELNVRAFPELANQPVDFALTLNGEVIAEEKNVQTIDNKAEWYFDMAWLTEKQAEYRIEGKVGDYSHFWRVYKYDRPAYLGADGVYRKNGEEIMPHYPYYYRPENFAYGLKDAKFNVSITSIPDTTNAEALASVRKFLDDAWEKGVYVIVATYTNMLPGGNPANRARTEYVARNIKDHPAVFAYLNMDEPFLHAADPHDDLRNTYIAVRNNDPYHPVITTEQGPLKDSGKYVDIFGVDPYPGDSRDPLTYPATNIGNALDAVYGTRPVYAVLQGFEWRGYIPSGDDLRNMIYQSFLAGGTGLGWFRFVSSLSNGTNLDETTMYEPICQWAHNEMEDTYKAFVFDEYPIFSDVKEDDFWAVSYVKDKKLRMIILNRTKEAQELSLALESRGGNLKISEFDAVCLYGGNGETVSGNGTLNITLPGSAAMHFEITPKIASEIENTPATRFRDLTGYDWAFNEILTLDEKGIANSIDYHYYQPEKNITRGDFAMFLIKTLGLTADVEKSSFTDVYDSTDYAKAVAIGEALGILKGTGNGKFNPEAEISRQDLMVICARGMRLVKELAGGNVSAYPDANLIADYANADVAAMAGAGIVKGNEEGNINPLGNATRAEAAVIMNRIANWMK